MTDTAQLPGAAETEVVSKADAIASAADAFKVSLGQIEPPARELPQRGDDGRFVSADAETEEIEAEAEEQPQGDAEEAAESQEAEQADAEAPDEGQPEAPALPESWPSEKAELWGSLPPEAQAFIAERDGQMKAAVGAKFQEAANLRKAHEAEIDEAHSNRQRYAEAADQVLSLVVPQRPPPSMLDYNSNDYDPDTYHRLERQFQDTTAFLEQHKVQLANLRAQETARQLQAINAATGPAFAEAVPDLADPQKLPAILTELVDYAVALGSPREMFDTPTTALEWHVLWKAREFDRQQEAKARVAKAPKPEPKKAAPAVKPGVATSRSAVENQQRGKAMDRLRREGSVEAGAAALKHLFKGNLT